MVGISVFYYTSFNSYINGIKTITLIFYINFNMIILNNVDILYC